MAHAEEVWKPINSNSSLKFEVSNYGNVRRLPSTCKAGRRYGSYLVPGWLDTRGYRVFKLGGKTFKGHRLVATAFIPNPLNYEVVNHKDGNKQNNHVDNLEWTTLTENINHAIKHGLIGNIYKRVGEQVGTSRYDAAFVTKLRKEYVDSDLSFNELAQKFGMHKGTVVGMINLKSWAHVEPPLGLENYRRRLAEKRFVTRQKAQYKRSSPSVGSPGSLHGSAKLKETDIVDIRLAFINGEYTGGELATKYGVSLTSINYIIDLLTWVHVPLDIPRDEYFDKISERKRQIKLSGIKKNWGSRRRFTFEEAEAIRHRVSLGEKQSHIAKELGVGLGVINTIWKRKYYNY